MCGSNCNQNYLVILFYERIVSLYQYKVLSPVPAKDVAIWDCVGKNDLIIVTNDEGFLNLSNVKGFPPKVILLKTGNQSNDYIEELLIRHQKDIELFYSSGDSGVFEIFGS